MPYTLLHGQCVFAPDAKVQRGRAAAAAAAAGAIPQPGRRMKEYFRAAHVAGPLCCFPGWQAGGCCGLERTR